MGRGRHGALGEEFKEGRVLRGHRALDSASPSSHFLQGD